MSTTATVPGLLFELGWAYKDQPNSGYRAPSGTYTVGDPHYGVPFKYDQDIILYLADRASQGEQIVRARCRDICRWLGASWRNKATLRRLQRVLSCVIFRPDQRGTFSPFRVGTFVAERQDGFIVELAPEFIEEVRAGAVYSLDVFRELRSRAAPTRYYLYLVWLEHQARNQAEHDPYQWLPRAKSQHKARQRLQEWDEQVRALWPECPFEVAALKVEVILRRVAQLARRITAEATAGGEPREAAPPAGRACPEPAQEARAARPDDQGNARQRHDARAASNGKVPRRNVIQSRSGPAAGTRAPPPNAWQHVSELARGIQEYARMLTAFAGSAIGPPRQRSGMATPRGSPTRQANTRGPGRQRVPKRQR